MPAPSPSPLHDILRYDDVAVKFLFEHYYVPLVIFAKNYLPDIEDCKDVVQGIFLHIVENREKFTSIDNLKAYLYQTTQNRCLKQLRHEGVKQRYIFESQAMGEEAFYLDHILEEEVYTQLIRPCREYFPHGPLPRIQYGGNPDLFSETDRTGTGKILPAAV